MATQDEVNRTLTWTSPTLAATCNTQWVKRPYWATKCSIGIGWSGTPTGTLALELSDSSASTSGAAHPLVFSTNPAGSAASVLVVDVSLYGAAYIRATYTRSSGSGLWTDSTGTASTLPTLTWSA